MHIQYYIALILLSTCTLAQPPQAAWFNDVVGAAGVAYGLHDNQGYSMDCLHIAQSVQGGQWFRYYGLYHTLIGSEFQVRLAASADLISWTFIRTLLPNADMPYIYQMGKDAGSWVFIAHEQWMKPNSQSPSQLGFKMYYTEADLFAGKAAASYLAPLMPGITLMGTPNIYSATMQNTNGYWSISSLVGFHYNQGRDHVMQGFLQHFADPKISASWSTVGSLSYDQSLAKLGLSGNIGDRDFNGNTGTYISLQEGNLGPASPTNWANWRVFMYLWDDHDKQTNYPTGTGTWYQLAPKTHAGSFAFGNPVFTVVPNPRNPAQNVVVVTYFIFSEGAGPGEAGSLLFYHVL